MALSNRINALNLLEHVQDGRTNLLRVRLIRIYLHHRLHLLLGKDARQVIMQAATLLLQNLLLLLLAGHVDRMLRRPQVDLRLRR